MANDNKKVYVGLSGGVDSSVSAAILKEQGYDVTGVFIKVWHPDFLQCNWKSEMRDAMRICAKLRIPFKKIDLEKEYKEHIIDYMVDEYKKGRTPNPDVMCNKYVKFGSFLDYALKDGADFVATGHYAQVGGFDNGQSRKQFRFHKDGMTNKVSKDSVSGIHRESLRESETASEIEVAISQNEKGHPNPDFASGTYYLKKAVDASKDQVYFLWTLTSEQLQHTLFPIGHLHKTEVRKLADKYDLHTYEKKDSQGLCFIGHVDMKDFLSRYIDVAEGDVLSENGNVIGTHKGSELYTIGERHGFSLNEKADRTKPYYIVSKDLHKNVITISHTPSGETDGVHSCELIESNIRSEIADKNMDNLTGQIRYHGELFPLIIDGNSVTFTTSPGSISPGQSLVVYAGDTCLGGGIIDSVL